MQVNPAFDVVTLGIFAVNLATAGAVITAAWRFTAKVAERHAALVTKFAVLEAKVDDVKKDVDELHTEYKRSQDLCWHCPARVEAQARAIQERDKGGR